MPDSLSKASCQCTLLTLEAWLPFATVAATNLRLFDFLASSGVHLVDFYDRTTLFAETLVNNTIHPRLEFEVQVFPVHHR